jgi:hypothetical protein
MGTTMVEPWAVLNVGVWMLFVVWQLVEQWCRKDQPGGSN